jgi:hypothetical protein
MEPLDLFGLAVLSACLVFYALEDRHRWANLCFAIGCALSSVYGFLLPKAWPFGVVEAVWTVVALRRWWMRGKGKDPHARML